MGISRLGVLGLAAMVTGGQVGGILGAPAELASPKEVPVEVPTPRGVSLEAFVDGASFPVEAGEGVREGAGGSAPRAARPVVVFAPGQVYDRNAPLAVETARGAAARGWIAVRFDWAYWTAGGSPSEGFANEVEDLGAAIAFARSLEGADASRVFVVAKSIGSVVAVQDPGVVAPLAGLVLLTPPIGRGSPADVAAFLRDKAGLVKPPLLVVAGDHDPLCPLAGLYRGLSAMEHPPQAVIVGGNHGLDGPTEAAGEGNRARAVHAILNWIDAVCARRESGESR